jgi:hypothetical protein
MKVKKFKLSVITGLLILMNIYSYGQSKEIKELTEKLDLFHQKYQEEVVYLQTDRSQYLAGESILFKAYIMDDLSNRPNSLSNTLYGTLMDQDGQEVASGIFPIMNNQAVGNLRLSKFLEEGNYLLLAYTNRMKSTASDKIFTKIIEIESSKKPEFNVDLTLKEALYLPGSLLTANIKFSDKNLNPVSIPFTYRLTLVNSEEVTGKGNADKDGKAILAIPLPAFQNETSLKLLVTSSFKGKTIITGVVIPTPDNYIDVKFYPESGMLLNGVESVVAFRAFNSVDQPVDFEGEIYNRENRLVKKISSIYKGCGAFDFNPETGQRYYLKITRPQNISKPFNLPEVLNSGVLISFKGINYDNINLQITPVNKTPQVYNLIGQTKGQVYWSESDNLSVSADINIPVDRFPMGVANFAVFDSTMKLFARRMIFINKSKQLNIRITTDKQQYALKDKVLVDIYVTDEKGNPVIASLSLSASNSASDSAPVKDDNLVTWTKLRSDLAGLIPAPQLLLSDEQPLSESLDYLLMSNYFTRFTWHQVLGIKEEDPDIRTKNGEVVSGNDSDFEIYLRKFSAQKLSGTLFSPGTPFIIQEKNNLEKIEAKDDTRDHKRPTGYSSDRDILDVIRQIKPYQLMGGKIVFAGSGLNSLINQDGALIIIDGSRMGTDAEILKSLPVSNIERINVSTDPSDIQRYTGLNNVGIIEIFTKKGGKESGTEEPVKENKTSTLCWEPDILTNSSGKATISFSTNKSSPVLISVEGITVNGLVGSRTLNFLVK